MYGQFVEAAGNLMNINRIVFIDDKVPHGSDVATHILVTFKMF